MPELPFGIEWHEVTLTIVVAFAIWRGYRIGYKKGKSEK